MKEELCHFSIYQSDDCTDTKKADCNQHVMLPNETVCTDKQAYWRSATVCSAWHVTPPALLMNTILTFLMEYP